MIHDYRTANNKLSAEFETDLSDLDSGTKRLFKSLVAEALTAYAGKMSKAQRTLFDNLVHFEK